MKAFVLHTRPYRDTSLIAELFTDQQGRLGVVAQGARNSKKFRMGLLQPFVPLLIECRGKTDLLRLESIESYAPPYQLQGKKLFSAIYLNEVLLRVLHRYDQHGELFLRYEQTLAGLVDGENTEPCLRQFEKNVLASLGYALPLSDSFKDDLFYRFVPGSNFAKVTNISSHESLFSGASLNAIAEDRYENQTILQAAKQLMRLALNPLLGEKPLKSRELFSRC